MDKAKRGPALLTTLRRLFAAGDEAAAPATPQNPRAARSRAARSSVAAGRFSLVGLSHVRDELGARWPGMAERVHALAESVISRHLMPGDVFEPDAHGDYVVLFCQLTEREAEFKARAIGREITRRLLGSEWPGLSMIETVVASIPGAAIEGDDLVSALATAFAGGNRFVSSHEDEPDSAAGEHEIEAVFAPSAGGPSLFASSASSASASSSLAAATPIGRPPPDWRYAPIWDFSHDALIYFRIAPTTDDRHAGLTGQALVQSVFAADLAALAKASEDLIRLGAEGRRLPIVCPLHGGALEFPARRRDVVQAIAAQPSHVRRLLTIELTAPQDWPRTRALDDFIVTVKRLTGGVSARLPARMETLSGLSGLSGLVTLQLPPRPTPEADYIRFLDSFANRARRAKLTCGVAGLTSRSLVMAASAAGFRYLSGPAVHAEVSALDQATRFDFIQLYADILPA
jgi:hypothetical protein